MGFCLGGIFSSGILCQWDFVLWENDLVGFSPCGILSGWDFVRGKCLVGFCLSGTSSSGKMSGHPIGTLEA